jgi:hypothetical protein
LKDKDFSDLGKVFTGDLELVIVLSILGISFEFLAF